MQTVDISMFNHKWAMFKMNAANIAFNETDLAVLDDITRVDITNEPTTINMAVFGLIIEGEGKIMVDSEPVCYQKNSYIVILPNQVVNIPLDQTISGKGIFICISNHLYNQTIQTMHDMLPLFFYIKEHPCAELPQTDIDWISAYHHQIFTELQDNDNLFRVQTVRALLMALLYKVCNLYGKEILADPTSNSRQEELFTNYLKLISQHYNEHREVNWYASQLCITPKYLSAISRQVSGQKANSWIQSYVIREAKNQLQSTHKSIQQIANDMNFPSQSFFGKYFKQFAGISPQEFRKDLLNK